MDFSVAEAKADYQRPTPLWPEPVDAEMLLDDLVTVFNRFSVSSAGAPELMALLVIQTYALNVANFQFAPRLLIQKPGSGAGGSTLLNLMTYLCRRPVQNSGLTLATYLRQAAGHTVIIDECHRTLPTRGSRDPILAALNAAHMRTQAWAERIETVNKVRTVRRFSIFGSVIFNGIGDYASAETKNRSFIVKMKRMLPGQEVEQFNPDEHAALMRELRSKIKRFVFDNKEQIRNCRPELPRNLFYHRARDNAMTLLKIADVAGQRWAKRAREAIKLLTAGERPLEPYEVLLGNIHEVWTDPGITIPKAPNILPARQKLKVISLDFLYSWELCHLLRAREDWPWLDINPWTLAAPLRLLDEGVEPKEHNEGGRGSKNRRGYYKSLFETPWLRYGITDATPVLATAEPLDIPAAPPSSSQAVPPRHNADSEPTVGERPEAPVASAEGASPAVTEPVAVVAPIDPADVADAIADQPEPASPSPEVYFPNGIVERLP